MNQEKIRMIEIFKSKDGEFPAVQVGQVMLADVGIKKEDLLKMDKKFAKCCDLDEQLAVLYDHPEVVDNIFLGALVSRRDNYVTLTHLLTGGSSKFPEIVRDFSFGKVIAIFPMGKLPIGRGTTLLTPKYINMFIAKAWKHVRWHEDE
jgi:hypothetical protein